MRGKLVGRGKVSGRKGVVDIYEDMDDDDFVHCKTARDEWLYLPSFRVTFTRNVP